jgi:Lon-like ATP-dependent protease
VHLVELNDAIEGASAGIPFVVAMVSALLDRPVIPALAMTGEISLKGRVTPVGGLLQKVTAAKLAGRRIVIVPRGNERDIESLPTLLTNGLQFHFVSTAQEAVNVALAK